MKIKKMHERLYKRIPAFKCAVDDVLLTCPHGCGPDRKLTWKQADEIMSEYLKILEVG